jgi:hypothetical protein
MKMNKIAAPAYSRFMARFSNRALRARGDAARPYAFTWALYAGAGAGAAAEASQFSTLRT